jgi:uncharacterized protein YecE (DUF72 family)
MKIYAGTSGYSYTSWKGSFYPEKLPQKQMLSYYAQQLPTVESNSTFRFLPSAMTVESWIGQVPAKFQFSVKAPEAITHRKRLKDAAAEVEKLSQVLTAFSKQLGPVLYQLPPYFKKDLARLEEFLPLIKGQKAAFEFRHDSWFDDEVVKCLGKHGCALCIADAEDLPAQRLVTKAKWGYLRLRRDAYTDQELENWIKWIRERKWSKAYVYFKHDEVGVGPKLAKRFLELAGE